MRILVSFLLTSHPTKAASDSLARDSHNIEYHTSHSMSLLDIPSELLTLIANCLGPSEVRKSVAYLLLAKRWYHAALPVYLSQLPLADLYLASHHDLDRFPPQDTALTHLIQTRTKRLSIRLVGHPSKCPSVLPWYDNTGLEPSSEQDGAKKWESWHCDWMTAGPKGDSAKGGDRWHWHGEQRALHQWASRINKKLVELAATLPNSRSLEEFILEASSECEGEHGPRWDYLHDFTIRSLILSFPSSLKNLTLDLCGSGVITPDRCRETIHLCPLIAGRLHDFQNVRLRLRCICPQVFQSLLVTTGSESKLRTLVIRLSLPYFPEAVDEVHNGYNEFDAKSCAVTAIPLYRRAIPLYRRMIAAGLDSAAKFPGLSMLRISYRSQEKHSTNLAVADCVRKRYMFEPSETFTYEDDGSHWAAWEDSETLQDGGSISTLIPDMMLPYW